MGRTYQYRQKMKNGAVYVFECEDEYVPELKQTRKKNRRLIGKINENGDVIPTRKKSTPQTSTTQTDGTSVSAKEVRRLERQLAQQKETIESLKMQLAALTASEKKLKKNVQKGVEMILESIGT